MLSHIWAPTGDYFIIAVEPDVGEMLQIPTVKKCGSFKPVFLAEVTEFPSGVFYEATCRTWQQVRVNKTSFPKTCQAACYILPICHQSPLSHVRVKFGKG
jgi:hypothetical protein